MMDANVTMGMSNMATQMPTVGSILGISVVIIIVFASVMLAADSKWFRRLRKMLAFATAGVRRTFIGAMTVGVLFVIYRSASFVTTTAASIPAYVWNIAICAIVALYSFGWIIEKLMERWAKNWKESKR